MQKRDSWKTDSLILQQLGYEYDSICKLYSFKLRRPIFELLDSPTALGRWDSLRRTLGVSSALIEQMPWNIAIEVLKHEIAHQICDELQGQKRLDHGGQFQAVCEALQVKRPFRRAYADLEKLQTAIENFSGYSDDVRERIKKLLALSDSDNQYESALALEKARKLAAKHSIVLGGEAVEDVVHEIVETKRKRLGLEHSQSMALISKYFNVTVISSWQFDPLSCQQYKIFDIIGRHKEVVVAVHCYYFLQQQIASAWDKAAANGAASKKQGRGVKNGFIYGMLSGFEEKLREQLVDTPKSLEKDEQEKSWQLTVVNDKDVVDYCRKRFPALRKARSRSLSLEQSSYNKGFKQGKELNLHKAMQGAANQHKLN